MADGLFGLEVGHKASFTKTVALEDIVQFAAVTGDANPLHLDEEYARNTRFHQRIAHGILSIGFISAALGTQLCGPQATVIYLTQNVRFLRPVLAGDIITAMVEVKSIDVVRSSATVSTDCFNQRGEQVVAGEALVLLDPYPREARPS